MATLPSKKTLYALSKTTPTQGKQKHCLQHAEIFPLCMNCCLHITIETLTIAFGEITSFVLESCLSLLIILYIIAGTPNVNTCDGACKVCGPAQFSPNSFYCFSYIRMEEGLRMRIGMNQHMHG